MMQQPNWKMMSYYNNTLLKAANIADIYQLTPDELLISFTLATCTDDVLKQELIKLDGTSMHEIQDQQVGNKDEHVDEAACRETAEGPAGQEA